MEPAAGIMLFLFLVLPLITVALTVGIIWLMNLGKRPRKPADGAILAAMMYKTMEDQRRAREARNRRGPDGRYTNGR